MRKTKVDAMSADSDSSQVEDAQAPLSLAEFSKRQVAVIERQMLSMRLREAVQALWLAGSLNCWVS